MKHLIIGGGNLGKDLLLELNKPGNGIQPQLLTASRGFNVFDPKAIDQIKDLRPNTVWYCVGGGSVAENKIAHPDNRMNYFLNTEFPVELAKRLHRGTRLVFFSTDYCASEQDPTNPWKYGTPVKSMYAMRKLDMENRLIELDRTGTTIVRVGSLYGVHKPERTFPGKVLRRYGFNEEPYSFPLNRVCPTPTRWLAGMLVQNIDNISGAGTHIHHCAPTGSVSVYDWAMFCLMGLREKIRTTDQGLNKYDKERPLLSALECSFAKTPAWHELWQMYFKREWFVPKELRKQLPVSPEVQQERI